MMKNKLRVMLAVVVYIIWTRLTGYDISLENAIPETIVAALTFLAFIFYSKFYNKEWVYYIFLTLLGVSNWLLEGLFSYFFYILTSTTILGYYIAKSGAINKTDYEI